MSTKEKTLRTQLALCLPVALFVFWFITASASMAVERIAAGSGDNVASHAIIKLADAYESPMNLLCKIGAVKSMNNSLADFWCDLLQAPETTP